MFSTLSENIYLWKEEDEREEEETEEKYKPGAAGYWVCNQDRSIHFEREKKTMYIKKRVLCVYEL